MIYLVGFLGLAIGGVCGFWLAVNVYHVKDAPHVDGGGDVHIPSEPDVPHKPE